MSTNDLQDMDQKQRQRNKKRLLAQNKKLNTQIRNLQKDITQIITTRQSEMIQNFEKTNGQLIKYREEITVQQKYINKLKGKINLLKAANTKGNAQFIIKQENELLILKKQYESLVIEKGVVNRFKQDKLKVLDKDKPFEQHKKQIQENLAQVRKNNRTMQAEIVQLEREVRKYHNYIVLSNTLGREKKQSNQIQYQITKNQHQIKQVNQKTKQLQQKWKIQFQSLDNELFQLKSQFAKSQAKLNEIEKQHRMWETRKRALRNQDQIIQFRDRLSKIQLLPQQNQVQNMYKTQKKKQKISKTALINLSKNEKNQEKIKNEQDKQQAKQSKQEAFNQMKKTKYIKNLGINNKSLRKSDKNILPSEDITKQKQKISIQSGKNSKADQKKNKEVEGKLNSASQQKNKNKNQSKIDIQPLQKSKSKDKILNSKQISKKQPILASNQKDSKKDQKIQGTKDKKSPKTIKENQIKSEKGFNGKEKKDQIQTLVKQKSEAKLNKSNEKNKQSPSKNDLKNIKQAAKQNKLLPQKGKNSPQKNKEIKVQSPKKGSKEQVKTIQSKQQKISKTKTPKIQKKEKQQKKPVKLLLKSVGVGTQ